MNTVTLISEAAIDTDPGRCTGDEGAVLQFLGVVRELENGRRLTGIRYTCYESMAAAMLQRMTNKATSVFGAHSLYFHHRIGVVPVAQPSVIIRVATGHSREAFALCEHYLREMKTTLPIWKEPLYL